MQMRERFIDLWRRACSGAGDAVYAAAFADLEARYAEPGRAYHTLDHIAACLRRFDDVSELLDDANAVEIAIWYHDIVYVIRSKTNEAESAEHCARVIAPYAAPSFVSAVRELVLVTDYPSHVTTHDQAYMTDIDLHSFGLPWDEFEEDGKAVRDEFAKTPDAEFYASQREFMSKLLASGHFYRSDYYKQHYQAQARENVRRYLDNTARESG